MSNGGFCNECGTERTWIPSGTSRKTGEPYEGFWGCPNRKNHAPKPRAQPNDRQGPPVPRQRSDAPGPSFDSRERSIAACACAKAACEALVGVQHLGMSGPQAHEWTVTMANKLFRQVVIPSLGMQLTFPVAPAPAPSPLPQQDEPQYAETRGPDDDIPF